MQEQISYVKVKDLKLNDRNPRKNDAAVDVVAKSIDKYGFKNPCIIDKDNVVWCGNTRLKAARRLGIEEVPCIVVDDLTEEQIREYALLDNKTNEIAEWDYDLLAEELQELDLVDFELDWGVNCDVQEKEAEEDNYEIPDEIEPRVKSGELWQLGRHRLMCGDSTKSEDVEKLMGGELADLVFTDPPYGMKKENDGVANDNLNYDDLLEFNKKWIPITFKELKDNGSWYCWGIDEPLMDIYSNILKPLQKQNKITFRNLITWDKGDAGAGGVSFMGKEGLRSYPVSDEKCLFVMCGVQGFNNNTNNYFEGWEPIRSYLEGEAKKVGLTAKKLQEICGVGMYCHWFTKSQFALIPEEHYLKLQNYFKKEYGAFKKEYDELKKEYYKTRSYFDNTHDKMKSVWDFGRVRGEERESTGGHATPKPIALCARAIKSSSRENEIVLDVFGGSGSTLIACEQLNRTCYCNELEPHWCDVIINRWEQFTGQKAEKLN